MSESENPQPQPNSAQEPSPDLKIIPAETLFEGEREVVIDHAGERYRLRITRRGKLILQK